MPLAKPLHLRLFLEGKEVPVISAQVQVGLWAPAAAAIQVVPLDEVLQLKPRTMVHLFFLEEPLFDAAAPNTNLAGLRKVDDSGKAVDTVLSDSAYKLLFSGELTGFSFVKTPMSRAVVLQCLDFTSYWDFLYAMMLDYGPQGNAFAHKADLYASNQYLFADLPGHTPQEKLRSWINTKPQTPGLENVGGLAGGIIAMMEIMGGLRNKKLGVNDFFTLAELRCHILSQVTAEDGDSTAKRLINHRTFMDWLNNNLQVGGGLMTLRDMFKILCQYIYYQMVPNPAAKFEGEKKQQQRQVGPKKTKLSMSRYFSIIDGTAADVRRSLEQDTLTTTEMKSLHDQVAQKIVANLPKVQGIPEQVTSRAKTLQRLLGEYSQGFNEGQRKSILATAEQLSKDIDEAGDKEVTTAGYVTSIDTNANLKTTIFRPECFMTAPPVCNVIFPEQYTQVTYDRNFLTEVTRVEIDFHSELIEKGTPPANPNAAQLLASRVIQPDMHDMSLEIAKKVKPKWRILMPHELHTGIIAREEWLPDSFSSGWLRRESNTEAMRQLKTAKLTWSQKTGLYHFFKYRIGPRTMNVAGRFNPYLVAGFPALVIQKPFYYKTFDTEEDVLDQIRKSRDPYNDFVNPDGSRACPPQFLGMVEGFTHTLGQDGGHTTLSLSHCRSHLGIDDEFVGKVLDSVKVKKFKTKLVRYLVTFAQAKKSGKLLEFLRQCTPQQAPSTSEQNVCTREQVLNDTTFNVTSMDGGTETAVTKKVAIPALAEKRQNKEYSPELLGEAPDPYGPAGDTIQVPNPPGTITVGAKGLKGGVIKLVQVLRPYTYETFLNARYYHSILVHEEVKVPYDDGTDPRVPVEYVAQPSWLSPAYDNDQVGKKIYQHFFGCDSIVDQIMVGELANIPPRPGDDGTPTDVDEDEQALKQRLRTVDQKRSLLSIEVAVNTIAFLYGKVRSEGLDVEEFIQTFVRRPIASKREVLGSYDLELQVSAPDVQVKKGTLGFFTLSLHPDVVNAKNLTGLMHDPSIALAQMDRDGKKAMAAAYDVRWEKLERVDLYIAALSNGSRGFVG